MRSFDRLNPITLTVYFLSVAGISAFCVHPVILALSFFGAISSCVICAKRTKPGLHITFLIVFLVSALINPIVSHRGATVLFFVNDTPITLESAVYGITAATSVVSLLYWFFTYNSFMSSDKMLYLFSKLSAKLSLVLSMSMRYVSLLSEQAKKIRFAQKATGLYGDGNIVDRARGEMRVFSTLVGWAIENGIISAESMTARGYGSGKRRPMKKYGFCKDDILILALTLSLIALFICCIILGAILNEISFFPTLSFRMQGAISIAAYFTYGALVLLPTVVEIKERIKWKYLRSKI